MLTPSALDDQAAGDGFAFRSDRLALDFAATLMFRSSPAPVESLGSAEKLARWAVASGLLSVPAQATPGVLGEALELRKAIYEVASARIAGRAAEAGDVAVLNRHGSRAPLAVALDASGGLSRSGTLSQVLATLARDAIELFGGGGADRLRRCERSGCTRLFVDRTRGRTRIWCGMRECGNRVNAAAYRRRRAAGPAMGQRSS